MVGFLGNTLITSKETSLSQAVTPDTTTLLNGKIITASNFGPNRSVNVTLTDPKTGVHTDLFTFAKPSPGSLEEPSVTWLSDGGFVVAVNANVNLSTTNLLLQRFDAAGNTVGPLKTMNVGTEKTSGIVELSHTDVGYFIGLTSLGGGGQTLGRFYNANGKLLNEIVTGDVNREPADGTTLKNGSFAAIWQALDGQHVQVFTAKGAPKGLELLINGTSTTPGKVVALSGGGFASMTQATDGSLQVLLHKNDGTAKGFPFTVAAPGQYAFLGTFDIAETKDGNIAVAWDANLSGFNADVMFSLYTAKGNIIVGPQVANDVTAGDQSDVGFSTLKNGDLLLSYYDDQFKNFAYSNASKGVKVISPDYFWEGNASNDANAGTIGDDVLIGNMGDDILSGGNGSDYLRGGKGKDTLTGGKGNDELVGDEGADILSGDSGQDLLRGGDGNDKILGGSGDDQAWGDAGFDNINGGAGNDVIYGGDGNDKLRGGDGIDLLKGEAGNDKLKGDAGIDRLEGGAGNDVLAGGDGNDILSGGADNDKLLGDAGDDFLYGGDGIDVLKGGDGNDTLQGDGGNDVLRGGAGDDVLQGLLGDDKMYGDAGADTFLFQGGVFGKDTIKDFEFGIDKLDMSLAATQIAASGGSITATEVAGGVKFAVDADNFVLVTGATLADFLPGDYDITPIL